VTQHGFALNVGPEMDYFNGIIGCGLPHHPAISMAELLGQPPAMNEVMDEVERRFGKVFDREMQNTTNIKRPSLELIEEKP